MCEFRFNKMGTAPKDFKQESDGVVTIPYVGNAANLQRPRLDVLQCRAVLALLLACWLHCFIQLLCGNEAPDQPEETFLFCLIEYALRFVLG